jgi:hypothetical protein
MTAITARIKGIETEFADGTKLIVPPLNLASIQVLQDRLATFKGGMDADSINLVVDATMMALQRNYPDLTRERVITDLIDLGNMEEVMAAVMDVSGLKRKEQEKALGEAKAGVTT